MKTADLPEPEIPDIPPEAWASAQEAVPIPYLAGQRLIGVHYITPALDILVVDTEAAGKKAGK